MAAASGDCFKKAAAIHLQVDTRHEAASNYTEAAQVLKRDEPKGACCLMTAKSGCGHTTPESGRGVLLPCVSIVLTIILCCELMKAFFFFAIGLSPC